MPRTLEEEAGMTEHQMIVHVDYYQYYAYGLGGDFEESSVDMVNDGILAPGATGVRISTGAHNGQAALTVRVVDTAIPLPPAGNEVVASACNLDLPTGKVIINSFDGPTVFEHDFGRPLTCGFLVEVHGRDTAASHNYQPGPAPVEHHTITISALPFPGGRWRSARIDDVGKALQTFTEHVRTGPTDR
jgi:hypothetical protein